MIEYNRKRDTLIFLHIQKAAGSTFNKILDSQYKKQDVISTRLIVRGKYGDNWVRHTTVEREGVAKRTVANMSSADKSKIKVLKGHFEFGWHELFPNDCVYITFLRDPVKRIVSQFDYINRLNNHHIAERIKKDNISLSQFVEQGISLVTDNGMTRRLAGLSDEVGFKEYDDSILDKAIDNIENHFCFVGLSEHFDESILLLKEKLQWNKSPIYLRKNVTKKKQKSKVPDESTIKVIKEHNQLDLKLYEYVRTKFLDDLDHIDNQFVRRLEKFKKRNGAYQNIYSTLHPVYSFFK